MCFFNNSANVRFLQAIMAILEQVSWSQDGNFDKCANFLCPGFRAIEVNSNNLPALLKRCKCMPNVSRGTQEFGTQTFDGLASLSYQPELAEPLS